MEILVNFFAIVLIFAGLAFIFAGPQGAARVFGSPFAMFGWLLRGALSAAGRGFARVVSDTHRFFYRRWPGRTVGFYLTAAALLILLVLTAGCAFVEPWKGARPGFVLQVERDSAGERTPKGVRVEKPTFSSSGPSITIGQGAWESGGVSGTLSGPEIGPDGKVKRIHKRLP